MIRVEGLTKYYGEEAAIRDLNFTIERGEVIGFLGLNGAGKSTTLRILGCVLLPTSGTVVIDGHDAVRDPHEVRKRIGFLPDTPPLYDEMTVASYLMFAAELRGVEKSALAKLVAAAAERTGLKDVLDQPVGALSHGYRQRVGIAQAIVHKPSLIILDEPTSGLDPAQMREMRQLIRELRGDHTVLLSSHNLPEISQTCDRLLVIHEGELVAQDSEAKLASSLASGIEIEVAATHKKVVDAVKGIEGVKGTTLQSDDGAANTILRLDADPILRPDVVRALVAAKLDVLRVGLGRGDEKLEGIFMKLTAERS